VPDQDSLVAGVFLDRFAYRLEDFRQGLVFLDRETKWVMDIDAVHFHRLRIEVGAVKGCDMAGNRLAAVKLTLLVDIDEYRGNLQQRVGDFVETAGLDIYDDRQVAAKALRHRDYISHPGRVSSLTFPRRGTGSGRIRGRPAIRGQSIAAVAALPFPGLVGAGKSGRR